MLQKRLQIALQKKGRLNKDGIDLLSRCGLKFRINNNSLLARVENLPIDILLVRDGDIPAMIMGNICDLGIVGENNLLEKKLCQEATGQQAEFKRLMSLNFGQCRLAIAFPETLIFEDVSSLCGLRIATSYPFLLKHYLQKQQIDAETLVISGSVEIAPQLGMSDAICDLVSTGQTLAANHLKEVATLMDSQAVLVQATKPLSEEKSATLALLLRRIQGVIKAKESKYILFHLNKDKLNEIKGILPGIETPTIVPLSDCNDKVAVHLVSVEAVFWDTLEKLKQIGASSILVLPIEKMMS